MSYEKIRVEVKAPLGRIVMNWPERRNALSIPMMSELTRALLELGERSEIRAVILSAEGAVFSSGHDLRDMVGRDIEHQRNLFDNSTRLMGTVQKIPQPVIAEVQGMATASGCQLVATCDLAVASRDAHFATPGVKIGLFCTTPMVALTRAVGRKKALLMLLTGQRIDGSTACDWGLVSMVVPSAELRASTEKLALQVAESSSLVVKLGKQAFYAQIELDQSQAYAYAKDVMSLNAMEADAQEGMTAFLEKRKPEWADR